MLTHPEPFTKSPDSPHLNKNGIIPGEESFAWMSPQHETVSDDPSFRQKSGSYAIEQVREDQLAAIDGATTASEHVVHLGNVLSNIKNALLKSRSRCRQSCLA